MLMLMGFIPRVNLSVLCDPILMAIAQTLLLAQYFFSDFFLRLRHQIILLAFIMLQ